MADEATAGNGTETTNTAATDTGAAVSNSADPTQAASQVAGGAEGSAVQTTADGQSSQESDWRTGLDGEHLEFAKRLASPADAVKVALDLRKANSSMIRLPGENAKPEDVAKFHKAIGVPDKPEDYKPEIGRELTDADKAVFDPITKIMHEHGVPAKAFTAVSKAVAELAAAQEAESERVALSKREEAAAALKKEWGADSEANMQLAMRALKVFGGPDIDTLLNTTVQGQKIGDHPVLIKAFAQIGRRMGEGEFIGAVGQNERTTVQEEINRIMRENPPGTDKYRDPAVQRRLGELHAQLHGSTPVVGAAGRAV